MTAERTIGDYGMTITDSAGHTMIIDILKEQGGNGSGFRPMQTVLAALCGCSTADVVGILKKQRQDLKTLKIFVDGEGKIAIKNTGAINIKRADFIDLEVLRVSGNVRVDFNR